MANKGALRIACWFYPAVLRDIRWKRALNFGADGFSVLALVDSLNPQLRPRRHEPLKIQKEDPSKAQHVS